MHQNRGINRTFVPIIVRVGLTLPVFPSVYYQHRIIRRTTPGQNRYAMTFQELNLNLLFLFQERSYCLLS